MFNYTFLIRGPRVLKRVPTNQVFVVKVFKAVYKKKN
jgi:hypothetical protein